MNLARAEEQLALENLKWYECILFGGAGVTSAWLWQRSLWFDPFPSTVPLNQPVFAQHRPQLVVRQPKQLGGLGLAIAAAGASPTPPRYDTSNGSNTMREIFSFGSVLR